MKQQAPLELGLSLVRGLPGLAESLGAGGKPATHPGQGIIQRLRLGRFDVDFGIQKPGQVPEHVPRHVGQPEDLGAHESIGGHAGDTRQQEPVDLVAKTPHVLQKHLHRQAQIASGEALRLVQMGTFGGFGDAYGDSKVGEKGVPQRLVVKIQKPPGDTHNGRC